MAVYFEKEKWGIPPQDGTDLPVIRYDCKAFILEEAFYNGNLCLAYTSAQGQGGCRKFILDFLQGFHADHSHFGSFEVEIDGLRLHDKFIFENQSLAVTKEGFEVCSVNLLYPSKNVRVTVKTQLDGSGFLVRWLEIENVGKTPFIVTGLFPMSGIIYQQTLGHNAFSGEQLRPKTFVGSFNDNYYLGEGEFAWQELPKATLKFAHEHPMFNPPFYMLKNDVACAFTVISIESSMMTQAEFTKCGDFYYTRNVTNCDYVHFKVGTDKRATARIVASGEKVTSAKIHFGQFFGNEDKCVNEYNFHLRTSVMPKRNQQIMFPVEYNHGSYSENCQVDMAWIKREVDMAAKVGAEVFVVDAGWFGSSKKPWYSVRGDWFETENLENGLKECFDYAREKKLMCGLWMEAEGMDIDSGLAKAHPDWFIKAYGRNLPTLNLLIPEVRDYVYNSICGVIDKYKLDLFRIDGGLKEPAERDMGGITEGSSWQYYEILYSIFESVRAKYPNLYLENCSGGGGRSDLGMMRRFDWMQATDSFAPVSQLRVCYGMSYALAPEQLLSITGGFMKHPTSADFIARSSLLGRPEVSGIAEKIENINEYCLSAWKKALKIYKEDMRPMLSTCLIFHHTPIDGYMDKGKWLVWEISSPDKKKSVAGIFRLDGEEYEEYIFVPKGIKQSANYEVYLDNDEERFILSGYELISKGIKLNIPGKLMSEMIVLTEK